MYNPLNEQIMFQDVRDRAARLEGVARVHRAPLGQRHWWQRAGLFAGHRAARGE